jgi:tetratricopeptide (TPR) repeat protein
VFRFKKLSLVIGFAGNFLIALVLSASIQGSSVAKPVVDPFAMQVLHVQIDEGFADIQRRNYESAKVKFASAYMRGVEYGALASSALAGSAQASFALGDLVFAVDYASRAIQLAQFMSIDHLILAFESRAHASAAIGNAKYAALDYMQVLAIDPKRSAHYQRALDRCNLPPNSDLPTRIEIGIARRCPMLSDVSFLSPQLLAKWYPDFALRLAAEQAQAKRNAELARQLEERRRLEQALSGGDPSSVPYMQGSTEAGGRSNIGFCNKSAEEVRIAMVRKKGKFAGFFGRTWIADGYYALAPSACTHRSFGYAEDFTDGYVSMFRKRNGRWFPIVGDGDRDSVGRAEWQSHQRSICWPKSAEGVDPDLDCPGNSRNLMFTHWFAVSGLVRRLTVSIYDGHLIVEAFSLS